MILHIHNPNGTIIKIQATQVITYNDDGHPVAVAYETGGLLLSTDVLHPDFGKVCSELKIVKTKPIAAAVV